MTAPTTTSDVDPDSLATAAPAAAGEVDRGLDEDDRPRARWERAIGWGIVALCTLMVFNILAANHNWAIQVSLKWRPLPLHIHFHPSRFQFGDLFRNTTANGGDMGAHVWWPKFLETNWFPKGRLAGWAPDWYAGFPVGQYYFPVPAVMVAILDHIPFVPYNVAFKLVTVSGPLMLPAAAYYFARGMRTPWPAPPAFALAAFGMLVQTRYEWSIFGGNIASTLAGEFSFEIALAFALFGLGALAYTLDTGKRRWVSPVLLALAIMSHIVIGIFVAVAATLIWMFRRPKRTWRIAIPAGLIAGALSAVWSLPLLAQQAYTQSMRYTKLDPNACTPQPQCKKNAFALWSWLDVPKWLPAHAWIHDHSFGPVRHTIQAFVAALGRPGMDQGSRAGHRVTPTLWLPWWIWLLIGVAIIAGGWYRRRSTGMLLALWITIGVMFIEWPEHAIWNTRFLPFWLITAGFLAAMGATELLRSVAAAVQWSYGWIRDGDLQDARARAWAKVATTDDGSVDEAEKKDAVWVLAERRFDRAPTGWEPPPELQPSRIKERGLQIGAITLAVLVVCAGIFAMHRAWNARLAGKPDIAITGWANWNYSGYEEKADYPQYHAIMTGMEQVADQHGNGRALWEPGDPINDYGTTLALELLPMFTHGKIDSMEGIYFESSATTDYHFQTVAECSQHPSNPVRGLVYGNPAQDFDLCVRHLQMLGVRYLMLWTKESEALADANSQLHKLVDIPGAIPGTDLKGWRVYQVDHSDLVVGMNVEPVVLTDVHGGKYSKCWGQPSPDQPEPELAAWECTTAPWWDNRAELNTMYAQSGPSDWKRVDTKNLANAQPRVVDSPPTISNVQTSVDKISFDVSEVGKPVEVKESYFPNWQVTGAKGPYRLSPNLMVVVPTSKHVVLNYGLTKADWAGRAITVAGAVALVLFGLWYGARRYAAGAPPEPRDDDNGSDGDGDAAGENGDGHDETPGWGHGLSDEPGPEPPDEKEPEPALP